jgi:hypothetical protein
MESQLMLMDGRNGTWCGRGSRIKENDPDANIVYQRLKKLCPQLT